jgi:phospholipid transport system transporter-binding protein
MIEIAGGSLRVTGPMVIATAAELKAAGMSALAGDATTVDLSQVTDADSSAVAVLLAWVRSAQERQRAISIVNSPESVRSLAALYGVADLLPLA